MCCISTQQSVGNGITHIFCNTVNQYVAQHRCHRSCCLRTASATRGSLFLVPGGTTATPHCGPGRVPTPLHSVHSPCLKGHNARQQQRRMLLSGIPGWLQVLFWVQLALPRVGHVSQALTGHVIRRRDTTRGRVQLTSTSLIGIISFSFIHTVRLYTTLHLPAALRCAG